MKDINVVLKQKKEYTAPAMELIIIRGDEVMVMQSEHDNRYVDFSTFFGFSYSANHTSDDYYRE